jgi:hypothetical protein
VTPGAGPGTAPRSVRVRGSDPTSGLGPPAAPLAGVESGAGSGCRAGVGAQGGLGGGVGGERGAAVVELLVVFLTLVAPLVYAMMVMADVQRAMLATSSAAREAGRVYVTGSSRLDAERRAGSAYREVLATFGVRAGDPRAAMRVWAACPPGAPGGCEGGLGPGAEVRVVVSYRVPVARLPFLGVVAAPNLTVGSTQHSRVDRYRGPGG